MFEVIVYGVVSIARPLSYLCLTFGVLRAHKTVQLFRNDLDEEDYVETNSEADVPMPLSKCRSRWAQRDGVLGSRRNNTKELG
jgi:hypothetical protein